MCSKLRVWVLVNWLKGGVALGVAYKREAHKFSTHSCITIPSHNIWTLCHTLVGGIFEVSIVTLSLLCLLLFVYPFIGLQKLCLPRSNCNFLSIRATTWRWDFLNRREQRTSVRHFPSLFFIVPQNWVKKAWGCAKFEGVGAFFIALCFFVFLLLEGCTQSSAGFTQTHWVTIFWESSDESCHFLWSVTWWFRAGVCICVIV